MGNVGVRGRAAEVQAQAAVGDRGGVGGGGSGNNHSDWVGVGA